MQKSDLILKLFFKSMFAGKDVKYKGKIFKLRRLNGLRRYDVGNLLFIEQNPKKETEWAKRAREGSKIMWCIDTKFNRYLARIENGNITRLRTVSNGER